MAPEEGRERSVHYDHRLPESVVRKLRFLKHYERFGISYTDTDEYCKAHGFNLNAIRWYLKEDAEFRLSVEKIQGEWAARPGVLQRSAASALGQLRHPDLPRWKGLFLEFYRERTDCVLASEFVMHQWSYVQDEMRRDPVFGAKFKVIEDEKFQVIEDAELRKALEGKMTPASARLLLKARIAKNDAARSPAVYDRERLTREALNAFENHEAGSANDEPRPNVAPS
jgi:hypothetical protein